MPMDFNMANSLRRSIILVEMVLNTFAMAISDINTKNPYENTFTT